MCTIHVQYNTWCQWRLGVHFNPAADADDGGDTSDAEDADDAFVAENAHADDEADENADELFSNAS